MAIKFNNFFRIRITLKTETAKLSVSNIEYLGSLSNSS